jgi:hypothetical protein
MIFLISNYWLQYLILRKKLLPLQALIVIKLTSLSVFPEFLEGNNFQLANPDTTHADIKICAQGNLLLW